MHRHLSTSLVIPVYNEEQYIENCLRAALNQTVSFDEIIVVDNNSTDATAAIVKKFKGVTLLREPQQGVLHARNTGFNAAKSEIIARIDGDTVLAPDWLEVMLQVFSDPSVDAATGAVTYREVCLPRVFNSVDFVIRRFMARRAAPLGEQTVQGVNMAVRKSAWRTARQHICSDREHHEDLDLAAHLAMLGRKTIFEPRMLTAISARQAGARPKVFCHYALSTPRTYRMHGLKTHRYMYPITWLVIALYLPIRLAYRGYNPATGRFSWRCLFSPEVVTNRPSPVAILPVLPE